MKVDRFAYLSFYPVPKSRSLVFVAVADRRVGGVRVREGRPLASTDLNVNMLRVKAAGGVDYRAPRPALRISEARVSFSPSPVWFFFF